VKADDHAQRKLARELGEHIKPLVLQLAEEYPHATATLVVRFDGAKVVCEGKAPGHDGRGWYGIAEAELAPVKHGGTKAKKGGSSNRIEHPLRADAEGHLLVNADAEELRAVRIETWPYGDGRFDRGFTVEAAAQAFVGQRRLEIETIAKLCEQLLALAPVDAGLIARWAGEWTPEWPEAKTRAAEIERMMLDADADGGELDRHVWRAAEWLYNYSAVDQGYELDTADTWVGAALDEARREARCEPSEAVEHAPEFDAGEHAPEFDAGEEVRRHG
jgi:hypothetical protein